MKLSSSPLFILFLSLVSFISCSKDESPNPVAAEPEKEIELLEFYTITSPSDLSSDVGLLPIPELQWSLFNGKSDEIVKYDIRLGTSESNLETIATDHTEKLIPIEFLLEPETTYYWQVVLENRDGQDTFSPIYQFTTGLITIKDPVIDQITRELLEKSEGDYNRAELESILRFPTNDESIKYYDAMDPYESPETLSGLEYFTNLEFLNLYGRGFRVPLTDITALAKLKKIKYLNLANNQIREVESLAGLTELTYLHLGWNTGIHDISPLVNLKNLKTLDLTYTYGLKDLTPLASLPQLDSLLMTTARYVENASVIGTLTNLKKLRFTSNDNIADFSFLENLTEMRDLTLYSNDSIDDISFLAEMPKLTRLNIAKNKVTDISILEGLTELEYLDLSNLKIKDFSALTNLTKLKEVWFMDDHIDESYISVQELKEALPNTSFRVNNKSYAKETVNPWH